MDKPLLIAHRGDTMEFPENTMEAFDSAFQKGADGVELDVHELDGKLVVVHPYTFDRNKQYPELKDVLESFADKGRLEVEIKTIGLEYIDPLKETLLQYPGANVELTTSVAGLVSYIRSNFPDTNFGAILPRSEFEPWMAEEGFLIPKITKLARLYKANTLHLYNEVITEEVVSAVHALGMKVGSHIHRLPIEEQTQLYETLAKMGVDQMTIDDVNLIKSISV
jgi:glycerophosphoryl diester phosphodiesterase